MQIDMTSARNGIPRPTLESTTPAVRSPGVTVELEPGGVSGGGREVKLLGSNITVLIVALYTVIQCIQN